MSGEQKNMKWPDGYCLDPNGKIIPPAGKDEDYHFGYEIGFQEAWKIMNDAIKASDRARFEAGRIVKEINKRKAANAKVSGTP